MTGTQTIPLDINSTSDVGTIHFKSVKIDHDWQEIDFCFDITSGALDFSAPNIVGKDSNGTTLYNGGFSSGSRKPNIDSNGKAIDYSYAGGYFAFRRITDYAALSTVTLTYQFEGAAPVTVTINIPGIQS